MKVCHVCSLHSADDNRVFHQQCRSLVDLGYDVHLVAIGHGKDPYQDYGVTIHPLSVCSRLRSISRRSAIARMAAATQPDLFHVHEPELLGPVIARAGSRPVIWDVHEVYLEVLMEHRLIPRPLRVPARIAWDQRERQLVRRCAAVVAATPWIAQRYQPIHKTVEIIANYADLNEIEQLAEVEREDATCVFAGVLNPSRGLSQVIHALSVLQRRGREVTLNLAGWPVSAEYLASLLADAERLGVRHLVNYHGALSRAEALLLMKRSSIGLVPYQPMGSNLAGVPAKLVECMAIGLPIVYADLPNHANFTGSETVGIAVDPTCPEAIANAIERLATNRELARQMGEAGKRAVQDRFNWAAQRAKLANLYRDIVGYPRQRVSA